MRNKYLLLGAASALMLAACSEDIKGPENNNKPAENALNLTSLNPASQAGRVSLPGQTRGQKSDRLQLVAKIAPLTDAATKHWSATGIAIANGNAYVSWHSDHQAHVQATAWGGAVDEISIAALDAKNKDGVITNTLTSDGVKFNNVFADGSDLYFPLTCYRHGAAVGKMAIGAETMDTIRIPGSSANAIEVNGGNMTVVTGYKGGAYELSTDFNAENGNREVAAIVEASENYGGKYVTSGKILRTTDEAAYLYDIASASELSLGAPLLSEEKFAESYDGETGNWVNAGNKAQYYGKHTMAVDGDIIYVAGGQGVKGGENGLRVYDAAANLKWQNGTNTTAVCVAAIDGNDYVLAATGAGLRVYEKYNGEGLNLYAFEVLNYDEETGMAMDAPGTNKPEAGTTAHSSNFVAVGGGYIFVACGQSGVYVFKLDTTVEPGKLLTGFQTSTGIDETREIEEETSDDFTVPAAPVAPAGQEFDKWVDENGNEYTPGDKLPLEAGTIIVLEPKYNDIIYIVKFDLNGAEGTTPADQEKKYNESIEWPAAPARENYTFGGWSLDGATPVAEDYKVTENVTFKAIWNENQKYSYTVSFNLEAAQGTVPASKTVTGYTETLKFTEFPEQGDIVKEGYNFLGWSDKDTEHQGKNTPVYKSGSEYPLTKDVIFYPMWQLKQSGGSVIDPDDIDG